MALNNCTITSQSFTKTGGSAIGTDNAQLIIKPDSGYVVSAANFTNNTGVISGVSSISLSDSGTPGASSNTVLVDVDLDNTFTMPSADTSITIDIDGDADLIDYNLSGNYSSSVSNITTSADQSVAYTASGNYDQQVTVFTRTFTANSGYYFPIAPSNNLFSANHSSLYDISSVTTTDASNRITSATFTVKFTFPAEDVSGDTINFKAFAEEFYVETQEIESYSLITSTIDAAGATRTMRVFGTPLAEFSLQVTNEDTTSIHSITNQAIPASGVYEFDIDFPAVTDADIYDFVLTGDLSSSFDTASGQDSTFSIKQPINIDIAIGLTNTDSSITISQDKSKNLPPNTSLINPDNDFDNDFTITTTNFSGIELLDGSTADVSDFTNTDSTLNGGSIIDITGLSFTTVSNTEITASMRATVDITGISDVTSILDLDDYIGVVAGVPYNSVVAVDDCDDSNGIATTIVSINSSAIIVGATLTSTSGGGQSNLSAGTYRMASGLTDGQTYNLSGIINSSFIVTVGASGVISSINECVQ